MLVRILWIKYIINIEVHFLVIYIFWIKFCAVYQILTTDIGPGLSIIVFCDTFLFNIAPQNNSHSQVKWLLYVPPDSKFRKYILATYLFVCFVRFSQKYLLFPQPNFLCNE
jgi:hypothetical protein